MVSLHFYRFCGYLLVYGDGLSGWVVVSVQFFVVWGFEVFSSWLDYLIYQSNHRSTASFQILVQSSWVVVFVVNTIMINLILGLEWRLNLPSYIEFVPTSFEGNFPGPEGNLFSVFKIMALMVTIIMLNSLDMNVHQQNHSGLLR